MIQRIESYEDVAYGTVTYSLGDGRFARFDIRLIEKFGLAALLEGYGVEMPTERLPVIYHGRRVGTMAPDFDPMFIRSLSFMYAPRPDDFKLKDNTWVAANNLGVSDLDCIAGFIRTE